MNDYSHIQTFYNTYQPEIQQALNDYFLLRLDCVEAYDPHFGATSEDALQFLGYRLEPLFLEWRRAQCI